MTLCCRGPFISLVSTQVMVFSEKGKFLGPENLNSNQSVSVLLKVKSRNPLKVKSRKNTSTF